MEIYIYVQNGRIHIDVDEELSRAEAIGILEMVKHILINNNQEVLDDIDDYNIYDDDEEISDIDE